MNMEEKLQAVVSQAENDGVKWHNIIHGDENTSVETENGLVPTVAKQMRDIRNSITSNTNDIVALANRSKNDAIQAKEDTADLKIQVEGLKSETKQFRDETENLKNQSQNIFGNISSAINTGVTTLQSESSNQQSIINSTGSTQVVNVQNAAVEQIRLATEQAERAHQYALNAAPTPLGTKLTIPASSKVPDGYEPVWFKNTITRSRYPDFFAQLVDTNSLVLVSEATYDSQVSTYGMCASYVKVDENTLILPLLVNFGRGGTTNQLGGVELDQFQGHYHIAQIRQDVWGSGDGATIGTTNGTDEGLREDGPDLYILNPKTGKNGTVRFGNETRPKAYYELTYIKCADVSRTPTMEETSQIRTMMVKLQEAVESVKNSIQRTFSANSWVEKDTLTGFIKQGGKVTISANTTVKFHQAFPNNVICVVVTPYNVPTNSTADNNYCANAINITNTSFAIKYYDSDSTNAREGLVSWVAYGY